MHGREVEKFYPLEDRGVDLRARGFSAELAAELRQRLLTFEEDWNAPGMEAYDEFKLPSSLFFRYKVASSPRLVRRKSGRGRHRYQVKGDVVLTGAARP